MKWKSVDDSSRVKFTASIEPFTLDVRRCDNGKLSAVLFRGVAFISRSKGQFTKEASAQAAAVRLLDTHLLAERHMLRDVFRQLRLAGGSKTSARVR